MRTLIQGTDLVAGARLVYELHRRSEVRNKARQRKRPGPIPTWDELGHAEQRRHVDAHAALRSYYDAGRALPREVAIRPTGDNRP